MEKIALIDVDGHNFPNLALMKISAYHKSKGDQVEFINLFEQYDIVYQTKVFTFTKDFEYIPRTDLLLKGGTGYDLENKLPAEIENIYPDYDLYKVNEAYGFLTRGCPRNCQFCIVGKKEGCKSQKVADLKQFWNGQKEIKLLDPNLLASPDRLDLLQQLIDSKAYVDFTQGLDARMLTDEVIDKIKQLKIKMVHFAWDNVKDEKIILERLTNFKKKTGLDKRKTAVYVLTNFNSTFEEDLYRIYKLRELDYDPYVMIYDKAHAPRQIRLLQRWVNNKIIFRSTEKFEEYDPRVG